MMVVYSSKAMTILEPMEACSSKSLKYQHFIYLQHVKNCAKI